MVNIHTASSKGVAAKEVARILVDLVNDKPSAILGLATGRTMIPVYREVVRIAKRERISFAKVMTFNLDEYVGLLPKDKESFRFFMNKYLFNRLDFNLANVHFLSGNPKDVSSEKSRFEALLNSSLCMDLQLLGIGRNGHIGFNEPGTSFKSLTHLVDLSLSTKKANSSSFSSLSKVPDQALTMGIGSILNSKKIILVAFGKGKSIAIQKAFKSPPSDEIPASSLQSHSNIDVFLDKSAASLL